MSAKAWELRATMSLARLIENQDRRDEARAIAGLASRRISLTE
jgi:hypothetical protein